MIMMKKGCPLSNKGSNYSGFTLVELMIAIFISSLIMTAIISVYTVQSRKYSEIDDLANIQQDLRGALMLLPMEIRLAGCDPTQSGVPSILTATSTGFQFTRDISGDLINPNSGDGDVDDANENITYGFGAGVDANNNGIVDNGGADWSGTSFLGRSTGGGMQPLAENIEAIEFNYILNDGIATPAPANLSNIRSVHISLLARSANQSPDIWNTDTYTTAAGTVWNPPDDNFRRRLVVIKVQLRNLGY